MEPEVLAARRAAASRAVEVVLSSGKVILGLGTGTTVATFVEVLTEAGASGSIEAVVPSSRQSEELARRAGIRVASLADFPELDVYVDSFDQVDLRGNSVKGGGAAHAREKVLMAASRRVVLVGDHLKLRDRLTGPVPVEVLPFAVDFLLRSFASKGLRPELRHSGKGKVGPVVTENGNFLIDIYPDEIRDPAALEAELKLMPGVVEVGICPNRGYTVFVGRPDGSVIEL
ncbi:MAG: ribose-5-phosphate isomerase RpiA [Aigarchaeota archaeon]|nr:ribose-5-phosphate isomerase RpiA [Candidatus Calditenuis fumarioli]